MTEPIEDQAPSIHVLVNRVLGELPAIAKTAWNEQQKFHFRGVDAVLNALNPLLAEHGVTVVPHKVLERISGQRQTRSGNVMYEVNLHVQYRLYGPNGDFIEGEAWGEGTDSGDKATSKAGTAAQKQFLIQTFSVSTQEQTDEEPDRHSPEETVKAEPASTDDVAAVMAVFARIEDSDEQRKVKVDFANTFGKPADLTAAQIEPAMRWLEKHAGSRDATPRVPGGEGGGNTQQHADAATLPPCRLCDHAHDSHEATTQHLCTLCDCPGYEPTELPSDDARELFNPEPPVDGKAEVERAREKLREAG